MGSITKFIPKVMPYFGILLTLLVVGSLLFLHLSEADVPQEGEWAVPPKVQVCPSAPEWASKADIEKSLAYWEELGFAVSGMEAGLCSDMCTTVGESGEARVVVCNPGYISITLADGAMDIEHLGLTVHPNEGDIPWATILLPSEVSQDPTEDHEEMLPVDAEELVLTHELGHAFGLGHAKTEIIPGLIGRPSGHIMNPSIYKTGWDAEGIE
jgi:hypothetical protein